MKPGSRPEVIVHRVNGLSDLKKLPAGLGAEIDLRSRGSKVILAHDRNASGPSLEAYLDLWARQRRAGTLILNPKEDGLDGQALDLLRDRGITRFFFLDLSLPSTVRLALRQGERRVALRVSEYESLESACRLKGKADWLWLDCFSGRPPAPALVKRASRNFKLCLVSPEVAGFRPSGISGFHRLAGLVDAVCTKRPDLWS